MTETVRNLKSINTFCTITYSFWTSFTFTITPLTLFNTVRNIRVNFSDYNISVINITIFTLIIFPVRLSDWIMELHLTIFINKLYFWNMIIIHTLKSILKLYKFSIFLAFYMFKSLILITTSKTVITFKYTGFTLNLTFLAVLTHSIIIVPFCTLTIRVLNNTNSICTNICTTFILNWSHTRWSTALNRYTIIHCRIR